MAFTPAAPRSVNSNHVSPPRPSHNHVVPDTPGRPDSQGTANGYESIEAMKAPMRDELADSWVDGGSDFLNAVVNSKAVDDCIKKSQRSRNPTKALAAFLTKTRLYDQKRRHWTVPPKPKHESKLYEPINNILTEILNYFQLDSTRRVFDSSKTNLDHLTLDDESSNIHTSPDVIVMGQGKHIYYRTSIPSKPDYVQAASVWEIKTVKNHTSPANDIQLAIYAREIFRQSNSRRFVYGTIMHENAIRVFMFDRCGVVRSDWVDYHAEPETFVRIVLALTLDDAPALGFDPNVHWEDEDRYINIAPGSAASGLYRVAHPKRKHTGHPFWFRQTIRGRGAVCWRVELPVDGAPPKVLVIKDSWRPVHRLAEWEFLQAAKNFKGVGQMVGYDPNAEWKVSSLRFGDSYDGKMPLSDTKTPVIDRQFSRVILNCYGKPLEYFKTRMELLCAFYDAVAGHQRLWEAGILHRDVSRSNILLGDMNDEGNRGILIDFDLAIDFLNRSEHAEGEYFTGTRAYQSRRVLETNALKKWIHDHIDDLESFFYVLSWICYSYESAGHRMKELPDFLAQWEHSNINAARAAKADFMAGPLLVNPVPAWFGDIFQTLLQDLRSFCLSRSAAKDLLLMDDARKAYNLAEAHGGKTPLTKTPTEDYAEFLGYIRKAIVRLEAEAPEPTSSPSAPSSSLPAPATPPLRAPQSTSSSYESGSDKDMLPSFLAPPRPPSHGSTAETSASKAGSDASQKRKADDEGASEAGSSSKKPRRNWSRRDLGRRQSRRLRAADGLLVYPAGHPRQTLKNEKQESRVVASLSAPFLSLCASNMD
ncbi:hypothetical protein PLICRDRAFT_96492 [Plicaturopsis crispa FD-325 SS-3]|nr:hypothetical protein PLICRDRAFT_96492 [Plicaturopsis crispa FD-325 SS-3]